MGMIWMAQFSALLSFRPLTRLLPTVHQIQTLALQGWNASAAPNVANPTPKSVCSHRTCNISCSPSVVHCLPIPPTLLLLHPRKDSHTDFILDVIDSQYSFWVFPHGHQPVVPVSDAHGIAPMLRELNLALLSKAHSPSWTQLMIDSFTSAFKGKLKNNTDAMLTVSPPKLLIEEPAMASIVFFDKCRSLQFFWQFKTTWVLAPSLQNTLFKP